MTDVKRTRLGDVAREVVVRAGHNCTDIPVFGVEKGIGLTSVPRYQSEDLSKYKVIGPGMFGYNPMRLNIGSIGYCTQHHGVGLVSPDYVVFECDGSRLESRFLDYHTRSRGWRQWLELAGEGSVRERIYFRNLASYEFVLPPFEYQRAAIEILGALDLKIDLNRRMNETLEAMARALYEDWFVDFGPTRAKMERQAPYLAPSLWSLFPDRIEKNAPSGWRNGSLYDLCELKRGYDLPKGKRKPGTVPIISSSGVSGFHDTAMVDGPGIVTGRYGTIGEVFYVSQPYWPLNTALYVRDFRGNSRRFVFHTLRGVDFLSYSDKGAVPGINRNHLHQAAVTIPPQVIQEAFDNSLSVAWKRIELNESETATLILTRDILLPKLMSGEIGLKDAAKAAEMAA